MISDDPKLPQLPIQAAQNSAIEASFWLLFQRRFYELWRGLVQDLNDLSTSVALKVAGPASATDEAIVRFDGTTGALVKDSTVTISASGDTTVTAVGVSGSGNFAVQSTDGDGDGLLAGAYAFNGGNATANSSNGDGRLGGVFGETEGSSAYARGGRLLLSTRSDGSGGSIAERVRIDASGNVVINTDALSTSASDGFLYVPSCAGTPTGSPTSYSGRVPIVVDTSNNKLYFYSGGQWRDAGP